MPFYYTPMVTAWQGKVTVPVTASYLGNDVQPLDVPNALANADRHRVTRTSRTALHLRHDRVAFTKRFGSKIFVQTSADYQWRNELRSAESPNEGCTSPLGDGSDRRVSAISESTRTRRTGRRRRCITRRCRAGTPCRTTSGSASTTASRAGSRTRRSCRTVHVDLNVCNFNCAFFAQNLDQNRSESVNLMNFRIDKAVPLGGRRQGDDHARHLQPAERGPGDQLQPGGRPRFGRVIAVLDPRVFQLGFRLEF